jgi:hypothetical protein
LLYPQATIVLSDLRPRLCTSPPATATKLSFGSGTLHWPPLSCPQATMDPGDPADTEPAGSAMRLRHSATELLRHVLERRRFISTSAMLEKETVHS